MHKDSVLMSSIKISMYSHVLVAPLPCLPCFLFPYTIMGESLDKSGHSTSFKT